jgi:hypothetical protein
MRNNRVIAGIILATVVVAGGLVQPTYGQEDNPVLLIQQTPAEGGSVTPSLGVHYYEPSAHVRLTAVAKAGYQFVYWLGDVGDPGSPATAVRLDSPKIVVAVFERSKQDLALPEENSLSGPSGGLFGAVGDYARGGFTGSGGRRPRIYSSDTEAPPEAEDNDLPAPESDDFPVPVPEPATVMLLLVGGMFVHTKTRSRNNLTRKVTK